MQKLLAKFQQTTLQKQLSKKKKIVGKPTLPDFRTYYQTIVIKTSWHWQKYKYINQWNRAESPQIDLNLHGQFICDKSAKVIQNEEGMVFFNKCARTDGYPYKKKMKPDSSLKPHTDLT